jgi:hypothetical protein
MTAGRQFVTASFASLALLFAMGGCSSAPQNIPSSAQKVGTSRSNISYMAPQDGTAYVYDHSGNKLLWSGKVSRGQQILADSQNNQIEVNGRVVSSHTMSPGAENELYFEPSPNQPMQASQQQSSNSAGSNAAGQPNAYNHAITVTPSVSVQPANSNGTVTVSPELHVQPGTPATQPTQSSGH